MSCKRTNEKTGEQCKRPAEFGMLCQMHYDKSEVELQWSMSPWERIATYTAGIPDCFPDEWTPPTTIA